MSGQQICQWFIVAINVRAFFLMLKVDVEGRPAKQPAGFIGIIGTFVGFGVHTAVLYFAGAFDALF